MARKGWDRLSSSYRQRLERSGIDEQGYQAGASLHKARGHTSRSHEQEYRRQIIAYRKYGPKDRLGYVVVDDGQGGELSGDRHVPDYLRRLRKQFGDAEVRRLINSQIQNRILDDIDRTPGDDGKRNWRRYGQGTARFLTYYHGTAVG